MSKRKAKNKHSSATGLGWFRPPSINLEEIALRATDLIAANKPEEALELLDPLLESYPRAAELHSIAATAYLAIGDPWSALAGFEHVQKIHPNPTIWNVLANLYLQVGMNLYALQAARQAIKVGTDSATLVALQTMVTTLEQDIARLVQSTGVATHPAETGLRHHDDAQRALNTNDYQECINACRRAIRFLGNWPPIHNNLAVALYYHGQPAEALTTTQNVLAHDPNNLHALSNAIKFLAWGGKVSEARPFWDRLQYIEPQTDVDSVKKAEAAAILEEDESVYQLLKPLVEATLSPSNDLEWQTLHRFAIAEANTGRTKSALRRIKQLDKTLPGVQPTVEALKAKRPGLGWSPRYPYFSAIEILSLHGFEEIANAVEERAKLDERQFRRRMERIVERYPQAVLVGKKLIWEDQQVIIGMELLEAMGTPVAYAVLREFGLSQAGIDEDRFQALLLLREAGQLAPDELVRLWRDGKWKELKLLTIDVTDEPDVVYPPKVKKLLEQGLDAFYSGKYVEAERLFKQILVHEPRAQDAYNNLGIVYAMQGDEERAKAMYNQALEINPNYGSPRCNLAMYLLEELDIEGAKEMIAPLANVLRLPEYEMVFYLYLQACILFHEKEYTRAEELAEFTLDLDPDFDLATDLLQRIQLVSGFQENWNSFQQRALNKRAAMQTKLKTADVTLDMALGLYTRETQGSMARIIIPEGGWSALHKKELHSLLLNALQKPHTLQHLVAGLSDEERAALGAVMTRGGTMPWDEFDERYGNDLEEVPNWQYHLPMTLMGRLRQRALLVETKVKGQLKIVVPLELRDALTKLL